MARFKELDSCCYRVGYVKFWSWSFTKKVCNVLMSQKMLATACPIWYSFSVYDDGDIVIGEPFMSWHSATALMSKVVMKGDNLEEEVAVVTTTHRELLIASLLFLTCFLPISSIFAAPAATCPSNERKTSPKMPRRPQRPLNSTTAKATATGWTRKTSARRSQKRAPLV